MRHWPTARWGRGATAWSDPIPRRRSRRASTTPEWYRAPIDPDRLQVLMVRRNARPAFDAILWLVLLCGAGTLAFLTLGTWWAIPAFAAFGALWGGSGDARWHENGHGTAFRSRWANDTMYNIASFMMLREPTLWRWSHVRHHSNTLIVGLDPEIGVPRPPSLVTIARNYLNLDQRPEDARQDRHARLRAHRRLHPRPRAGRQITPRRVGGPPLPSPASRSPRRRHGARHDRAAALRRAAFVLRRLALVVLRRSPSTRDCARTCSTTA